MNTNKNDDQSLTQLLLQQNNHYNITFSNTKLPIKELGEIANKHPDLAMQMLDVIKTEQQASIKQRDAIIIIESGNITTKNNALKRHQWMAYTLVVLFIILTIIGVIFDNQVISIGSFLIVMATIISEFITGKTKTP